MIKSAHLVDECVSAGQGSDCKGASLVEYCLLGAIIALTVMLAMPFLSNGISSAVVKGGSAVLIR